MGFVDKFKTWYDAQNQVSQGFKNIGQNNTNQIYCTQCGAKILKTSNFCDNCGAPVEQVYEQSKENYYDNNNYRYEFNEELWQLESRVREEYEPIISSHYQLLEKIGVAYTTIINLYGVESEQMDKVIDLCLKDIEIAPKFAEYETKISKIRREKNAGHVNYGSFERLAIIYEKRKEYGKAIEVCMHAIQLGFSRDSTSGQMPGRMARLMKKTKNVVK